MRELLSLPPSFVCTRLCVYVRDVACMCVRARSRRWSRHGVGGNLCVRVRVHVDGLARLHALYMCVSYVYVRARACICMCVEFSGGFP